MTNSREELLDHAMHAFALHGYDAVGVQEIAAAAGVAKPTLYHFFGSKSGLLEALFSERLEPFMVKLAEACVYRKDVTGALLQIVNTYFNFAEGNPRLCRFFLSLVYAPPESEAYLLSRSYRERQQQLMETFFIEASKDHGNMRGRHQAYAASFLGIVNTYVSLFLNDQIPVEDAMLRRVVHQFMHGIFS